jgi:hypothetical protein
METVLLTARWGSTRHLVRLDRESLADFALFAAAVRAAFKTLAPAAALSCARLLPGAGGDPTKLTEAEICDATDLSALR